MVPKVTCLFPGNSLKRGKIENLVPRGGEPRRGFIAEPAADATLPRKKLEAQMSSTNHVVRFGLFELGLYARQLH
jgi:hypothetical protein